MRPPRNVSPAAARRRALLVDAVLGVTIGVLAIVVAAGIGVVGFFGLLGALVLVPWYVMDGGLRSARRGILALYRLGAEPVRHPPRTAHKRNARRKGEP